MEASSAPGPAESERGVLPQSESRDDQSARVTAAESNSATTSRIGCREGPRI